jgi:hypothetical protein
MPRPVLPEHKEAGCRQKEKERRPIEALCSMISGKCSTWNKGRSPFFVSLGRAVPVAARAYSGRATSHAELPGAIENKAHQKCPPAKVPAGKMRDKRDMESLGTGSHPHCRQGSSPGRESGQVIFDVLWTELIPRSMQCPDSKSYRKPPENRTQIKNARRQSACGQNTLY